MGYSSIRYGIKIIAIIPKLVSIMISIIAIFNNILDPSSPGHRRPTDSCGAASSSAARGVLGKKQKRSGFRLSGLDLSPVTKRFQKVMLRHFAYGRWQDKMHEQG